MGKLFVMVLAPDSYRDCPVLASGNSHRCILAPRYSDPECSGSELKRSAPAKAGQALHIAGPLALINATPCTENENKSSDNNEL